MWILGLVVGLPVIYAIYGAVVTSPYQRRFAGDLPPDENIDGYLKPREIVDADEGAVARRVAARIAADSLRRPRHAGRNDPMFHEPHWGHTSGLLRGELVVDRIDALPARFRVGLLSAPGTFPLVARAGIAKDPTIGFAVNRVALKLKYPGPVPNVYAPDGTAPELDLLLAEGQPGVNATGHEFFVRDGLQMDLATALKPPTAATIGVLSNWRNLATLKGVLGTVGSLMKPVRTAPAATVGWAGKTYFSLGPFALGEGAMKFCLVPRQTHHTTSIDPMKGDPAPHHRHVMKDWLAKGQNAEFDLCVQLATPDCIPTPGPSDPPKAVMAAEYCDLHWDEGAAPYVPVGRVTIFASDAIDTMEHWAPLQFNAWNTFHDMRPLGQLFRLRKHVHAAHSEARVSHLYGATPGEMVGKCPFGQA